MKDAAGNPLTADKHAGPSRRRRSRPPRVRAARSSWSRPGRPVRRATTRRSSAARASTSSTSPTVRHRPALAGKSTVILGAVPLSRTPRWTALQNWVAGGGNLIAMQPDKKLAGAARSDRRGRHARERLHEGRPGERRRRRASTRRRCSSTARPTATRSTAPAGRRALLDATTATSNPAVTLRDVGTERRPGRGVHIRPRPLGRLHPPGQPGLGRQKRDGRAASIRPDDLFFGAKAGDVQPDWVDPEQLRDPAGRRAAAPAREPDHGDEPDKAPLPRFWYLPRGEKAAIVLTGDDHDVGGTAAYFNRLKASEPAGCSVADWECVRATSYMYPDTPLTDAQAGSTSRRLRDRPAPATPLRGLHPDVARERY